MFHVKNIDPNAHFEEKVNKMVLIGKGLNKEELQKSFEDCLVSQ